MITKDVITLAKEYGDWNGETVEMNDVGIESFYKAAFNAGLKAAGEKMEPVAWVDRDGCLLSEDQREEPLPKSWYPLYSLEDWK